MGKELAERSDTAAAVFREADASCGFGLSALCFSGTEAELARTEVTQPALVATSVAAYRVFRERGGTEPGASAGHSLGEYSAHVAAGTMALSDAVAAVHARGRFMQEAVPEGVGAMAAILGIDRAELTRVCERSAQGEVVSCANFNGPGQIVIAGHSGAVGRACELALASGAKRAIPLAVSAPFHCALMAPAAARLAPLLASLKLHDAAFPVYTNVDAAPVSDAPGARDALVRQVEAPVRWDEVIERMIADGFDTFVEFGPGKVLSSLVRRIARETTAMSAGDTAGIDAAIVELSR
jgi:[acyl-carrier-protein] S-malonyltransferase